MPSSDTATLPHSEVGETRGAGADERAALALLLQVSDSAYPIGAFSHSGGLEGVVQLSGVTDEADLRRFLETYVRHTLEFADLPLLRLAYEATTRDDASSLARLDALSAALRTPEELRLSLSRMGRQRLDLLRTVVRADQADPNRWSHLTSGLNRTQAPVIAGLEAALETIPLENALIAYGFATFANTTSAALKLLRLGQTCLQRLLHDQGRELPAIVERSRLVAEEELGTFTPFLDIAAARHERAASRLFAS